MREVSKVKELDKPRKAELRILKAEQDDIKEILALQYRAYQSEAIIYNDFSIQPLTQTLEQAVDECQYCVLLKAVLDDRIIGSVRAYEKNDTAYVGKLMVDPDYQNQGLGRLLLQAIESEFPGKRFELFTGHRSVKNITLYEKCGYSRFKEEKTPEFTFVYLEKPAVYLARL